MKHFLQLYLLIFFSVCGFSQIDVSQILKTKDSFEMQTNPIFKKDSLVVLARQTILDPSYYIPYDRYDKKTIDRYKVSVFYYTNANSSQPYYTKQWNAPIVIYFDKSLPKQFKKSVKQFISTFDEIDNLNISITKNKKKANYYIKPSDKDFTDDNYAFDNDSDKENFAFNNGDYIMITSGNEQIHGCILELNTNSEVNTDILESNLNQLFFLSLGRFFVIRRDKDTSSFLCPIYKTQEGINESDLNILKIHYNHIYEFPINNTEFRQLTKIKL